MQMEFKDKLIEKLTDELEQFRECRNRARWNTLQLVDNTLSESIENYTNNKGIGVRGGAKKNWWNVPNWKR